MSYRSLRNITAAIILAGTALAATALAPTTASAHGHGWGGGHGWGHGWGHHWGHHWGHGHWGYGGCWPHKYINAYGEVVIVPGCH